MKTVRLGISNFLSSKNVFTVTFIASGVLFTISCLFQNGRGLFDIFGFEYISFTRRTIVFFQSLYDLQSMFNPATLTVTVISSLLGGLSIGMLYAYYKARGGVFQAKGLALSGMAYFITLLGIQCVACGTAILTTLLTALGGIWINNNLPFKGLEVGIVGIIIQGILIVSLTKKLAYPTTC